MSTPQEIGENEHRQVEAFKTWINSPSMKRVPNDLAKQLTEYVEGLHKEIADLQADLLNTEELNYGSMSHMPNQARL